ncbi:MAG: diguanylate cyclase [Oceanospirillaceae bacterium]|nr:diguanylate cyclase [Oceanospirillaceae bacterium]
MLKEKDIHIFESFHSAMWIYDSRHYRIHWGNSEAIAFWRKKDLNDLTHFDYSTEQTEADRTVIKDDLDDYKLGHSKSQWCSFTPADIAKEVYCHFSGIELNDGRVETLIQVIVSKVSLDSELSVHTTSTLVSLWDISGELTSSNHLFKQFYADTKNNFNELFPKQLQAQSLWSQVLEHGHAEKELCLPTLDGNRWYQVNLNLNKKGHTERITMRQLDTTARKHRELHHQKLATTDQLTQIYNRFGVTTIIDKLIANRTPFTLFLIDLDKFKNINDYYGHDKGDAVLKAVAFRLQSVFNDALAISRLGGDEFLILMSGKGQLNKQSEGSKLTRCLNTPYHINGLGNVQSGGSIGVVSYPSDADNMSELLLLADTAMYSAKTSKFEGCSYFNPEMAQPLKRRQQIRNSMQEAIDSASFLHHFEPILLIDDRTIAYHEIQTYWLHPELDMLQSDEFEHIADEMSLMSAIELQALTRACKQVLNDSQRVPVLIKISINELQSGRTYKNLQRLSSVLNTIPFKIQLAVSEKEIAGRELTVAKQLDLITKMNISIVLDDFSTGGINLNKLSLLPIKIIRFHKDFTLSIGKQKNTLLASFLLSAKAAKYQIICKGVNNIEIINILTDLGCDFIQDLPLHLIEKKQA